MSYDLRAITRDAVIHGMAGANPPITASAIEAVQAQGKISELIAKMISATREAAEWGAHSLGARPDSEELDAIALHAVLEALSLVVPPEGAAALVQAALLRWLSLEDHSDESISEALYQTAREMGLEMRTARTVDVIDEAEELLGRFIEL